MRDAQRRGDGGRREHVGRVEIAEHQPIADIGPRRFAHKVEAQAARLGEALVARDNQQGCVG